MTKELVDTNKELGLQNFDLDGVLPDLYSSARALPIDLVQEYWSPEAPGETKRVYFKGILEKDTLLEDDTRKTLRHATFLEQTKEGNYRWISNASVRLVQHMEDMRIKTGTPLEITYKGKARTRGGFNIDTWQIRPLQVNIQYDEAEDEELL